MKLENKKLIRAGFLVGLLALAGQQAAALPVSVYDENFSTGVGAEWSSSNLVSSSLLTNYHGNFSTTSSTTLTLTGLSAHTQLSLAFDLYLFWTWDGNNTTWGPDYFSLNGDVAFMETFTNHQASQSYLGSPDECYVNSSPASCTTANSTRTDVYRDLGPTGTFNEFLVSHTGSTFSVTFGGPTTQADEWWGIDNVRVSIDSATVPEPTTLALLGLALMGLGYRRKLQRL